MDYSVSKNNQYESLIFKAPVIQTTGKDLINIETRLADNDFANYQIIKPCNTVTTIPQLLGLDIKLTSKQPFQYTFPFQNNVYYSKNKITDYLYEITYGNIDYQYAYDHFIDFISGACSAIRNGKWFGRNFDWKYNHQVTFVVHTPKTFDRLAVLGVSGIIPGVIDSNANNTSIIIDGTDMHKLIPFYLLDGVNEKGVFCTYNITPTEDYIYKYINPSKEVRETVSVQMLVRFILDRFNTAQEAITYLTEHVLIYIPDSMLDMDYQCHFLIGDYNSTYVIEFERNKIKVINANYITNFTINNVKFNSDHTVKYPNPTESGIYEYGFGLERWDIIAKNYSSCITLEGMQDVLNRVKYSNFIEEPFWYSELVKMEDDIGGLVTVDTLPEDCQNAREEAELNYLDKDRDTEKAWITCHSSIYNICCKELHIKSQEEETKYQFHI